MTMTFRPLLVALMSTGLTAGAAYGQMPELKFSGFGTLAATYSDERKADFVTTIFQPNGVGYTRPWSLGPDSMLGGQVNATFNDQWSAVVQVIAKHHHDNSFTPQIEWANVKYQVTPELSVRAGRIAAPAFLVSDSRFVGYSQPWVRPPVEVYGVVPITSNDGVDLLYRKQFGSFTNAFQAYYGNATAKLETSQAKSSPGWGINNTVQVGDLTLRAGYSANKVDLLIPSFTTLLNAYSNFGAAPGPIGPQARALVQKYSLQDLKIGALSLAASYDPGKWFVMTEFVDFKGKGILADSQSWYVTGGYRFGSFTPYATYASTKSKVSVEPGLAVGAAAPLNAGLNTTLNNAFNGTQSTTSVGMRWDFMKNTALKAQYDYIALGANSAGRLSDVQPGFVRGGHLSLFSVALDFVF